MKWYKHLVDSGDDPDVDDAVSLYGYVGYYVFFRTLEVMAREFDVENPGRNKFSLAFFRQKFRCNWATLREVLGFYQERNRIYFSFEDEKKMEMINLNCPKLKKLCDEYTKKQLVGKSGQTPDTVGTNS